jgi:hypothetical protein
MRLMGIIIGKFERTFFSRLLEVLDGRGEDCWRMASRRILVIKDWYLQDDDCKTMTATR